MPESNTNRYPSGGYGLNPMSERTWWIIMGGWCLCVVVMFLWMYWDIKKAERQEQFDLDYEELFQQTGEHLAREQDGYQRDAVIPIKGNAWLERARRAEALGFLDDEPTRSA